MKEYVAGCYTWMIKYQKVFNRFSTHLKLFDDDFAATACATEDSNLSAITSEVPKIDRCMKI